MKALLKTPTGLALAFILPLIVSQAGAADVNEHVELIRRSSVALDEFLKEGDRTIVAYDAKGKAKRIKVKPVNRQALIPTLAYMLNMREDMLSRVFIQKKYKLSEVLFARHLADKTGQPFEDVLTKKTFDEWIPLLKEAQINLSDVAQSFDQVYTEVAFAALDKRR